MTIKLSNLLSRQVPQSCYAVPPCCGNLLPIWTETHVIDYALMSLPSSKLLSEQVPKFYCAVVSCRSNLPPIWTETHVIDRFLMASEIILFMYIVKNCM